MSLLTICQYARREIGDFSVPSTIISNTDPIAVQLLALANRTGRTLALDFRWQVLLTNYTFPTVASTEDYALPSDFGRFANVTMWDRTNDTPVRGPLSPAQWEYLQSSGLGGAAQFDKAFRVIGDRIYIYPEPDAAETIAYQYYSTYWISGKAAFSADADVALIDEDLITLGIKWRFLASKGDSFENEQMEYYQRLDSLQGADGGRSIISFGPGALVIGGEGNMPEVGFG